MAKVLPVLLMTRPQAASERFSARVAQSGLRFRTVISPLIGITFDGVLPVMDGFGALIFTSANGVAAYAAAKGRIDLPAFTVGKATAQAARDMGLQAESAGATADALVRTLSGQAGPFLHICGAHRRGGVAQRLSRSGTPTREAQLYDQPERPPSAAARAVLKGTAPVIAPVFSPRSGAILAAQPISAPLSVAAMSEAVANAVASLHKQSMRIAARPDSEAMCAVVTALLAEAGAPGT